MDVTWGDLFRSVQLNVKTFSLPILFLLDFLLATFVYSDTQVALAFGHTGKSYMHFFSFLSSLTANEAAATATHTNARIFAILVRSTSTVVIV